MSLDITNATRRYGNTEAVSDVTLAVNPGNTSIGCPSPRGAERKNGYVMKKPPSSKTARPSIARRNREGGFIWSARRFIETVLIPLYLASKAKLEYVTKVKGSQ